MCTPLVETLGGATGLTKDATFHLVSTFGLPNLFKKLSDEVSLGISSRYGGVDWCCKRV